MQCSTSLTNGLVILIFTIVRSRYCNNNYTMQSTAKLCVCVCMCVRVYCSIILRDGKTYSFPSLNVNARYESARERFTLVARTSSAGCSSCGQSALMRATDADGSVQYKYGDRTLTEWPKSNCPCGYKHFFAGHEYENFPYR